MKELTFKNQKIVPVMINGQPYLRVPQIAVALQYKKADRVNELYARHADEFTPDMTFLTEVDTAGGKQQVRVFSLRGCHLLAMFAKTPVAKDFRRWALDLIEQRTQPIPALDANATGRIVKKCCAKATREEITTFTDDVKKELLKRPNPLGITINGKASVVAYDEVGFEQFVKECVSDTLKSFFAEKEKEREKNIRINAYVKGLLDCAFGTPENLQTIRETVSRNFKMK